MADVVNMNAYQRRSRQADRVASALGGDLPAGGGGGTFSGMEERFCRIEEDIRETRADMKVMREDITLIRIQMARQPTTAALWSMMATVIAIAIAMAGLSFVIADWARGSVP